MGTTLTIRVDDDLDAWLGETARKRVVSKSKVVRTELEEGRRRSADKAFMRLAGIVAGPRDLSTRRGLSRR